MSRLSTRIEEVLHRFELSTESLAAIAHVAETEVRSWLDDRAQPAKEAAICIQTELGVSMNWLMSDEMLVTVGATDEIFIRELESLVDRLNFLEMATIVQVGQNLLMQNLGQSKSI